MRKLKPEVFQGSLRKKPYFEGWYFKHVSADEKVVYAFIPAVSLNADDPHAFIQVINGITGETQYVSYPLADFRYETRKLWAQVGNSTFTREGIQLDIADQNLHIKGELKYRNTRPYPGNLLAPGIMGWYSWVPFMECYHGVVSANHRLEGELDINGQSVSFEQGKGYIEKDWGKSFPECWIWMQANGFEEPDASVFLSIAKIPWMGKFFMGFIAFLYYKGRYYRFATYNKSKLVRVERKGNALDILLERKNTTLNINIHTRSSGELIAPLSGSMSRRIKESIDSEVEVCLKQKEDVLFSGSSRRAGLEIIEGIFEYL